jgi:DNA-binding LacI/PurR family transcriptional regulator
MTKRAFGRETKFQRVKAELETLANRLGPDEKLPAIRDLAENYGVSLNTLVGVLDELENLNIVYRRAGKGVFVSPSRPRTIWLICNPYYFAHNHSPFWDVLVEEAHIRASNGNENLSMHFSLPIGGIDFALHQTLVEEIKTGKVQGIIAVGLNVPTIQWIEEQGVPCIAYAGRASHIVAQDYGIMVRLGVKALVERGCRRLSLWRHAEPIGESVRENCPVTEMFVDSVRSFGLEPDPALIKNSEHLLATQRVAPRDKQGYQTAFEVFDTGEEWPDGVLITEDIMAHGALLALAKLGIRPGRDMLIASHSNRGTSVLLGSEEDIIRLEFDPAEIVQNLFEMLEILMSGGNLDSHIVAYKDAKVKMVEPRLVLPIGK